MSKFWMSIYQLLTVSFSYHLVRDILQALNKHTWFTNIFHWQHQWCGSICDVISIPPELFVIVGSIIVIKRNRIGKLGISILLSLIPWPILLFLP